ncbi:sec-independent protein translocase protein TatA [Kitasatospora sp. SolWspMP-SS2h]|uniref:twin-arginine translocase TatA/TatE family subunit n=1 Tax=Kitasatospora sp. SolWspMP-SS2h TaxID=1305729 RepID=UPI000DBABEF8|nr:twin-arginine translocase TatA/TatE family subunit [Kitasatospora sp. SolWspMP-SS2h]RAJ46314.1 sec-independent protein translocase protein TatA [Kitasatospora sp. SolWspMP-SS2h]
MRLLSPGSLLLVTALAVLLFGGKRLPDAARALGRSLRILKSEGRALRREFDSGRQVPAAPAPAPRPAAEPERVVKAAPGGPRPDRAA